MGAAGLASMGMRGWEERCGVFGNACILAVLTAYIFVWLMGGGVGTTALAAMLKDKMELERIHMAFQPIGPEGIEAKWGGGESVQHGAIDGS
jgi:hypothetical protein